MGVDAGKFDLSGRVAVVTGAGPGFGRVFCEGLARYGATVVALHRDPAKAQATVDALHAAGHDDAYSVQADISEPAQVEAALTSVGERSGQLDVLVNNAGLWSHVPALELSLEEWNRVIATNLTGTLTCCTTAGRMMLERGSGSIINVSSLSSVLGFRDRVAYAASKHGDLGITRVLANEWAAGGVRVNALGPGAHLTEMTKEWRSDPEVYQREFIDKIPMGRLGDPEELIGPLVFLAGDASSYMTGQTVFSDGGWLLM
jgi:NAD(P)-dependent dehydrogenase (short-subunit alcohol dehydrogenase family)